MPCAVYHILLSAYYLAARFTDDLSPLSFTLLMEAQNQARAIPTGALCGAQAGFNGIPQRFIEGLEQGEEIVRLATQLARQAE